MELHTIGILENMGTWAMRLAGSYTSGDGTCWPAYRGAVPAPPRLSAAASITGVEDDETLVRESQILLSMLPPSQATALARASPAR